MCTGYMLMFDANTMVFSKFGCLRNALHGFSRFHPCRLLVYLPFRRYTICVVFQYVNLIPIDAFTTAVYVGLTKTPFLRTRTSYLYSYVDLLLRFIYVLQKM